MTQRPFIPDDTPIRCVIRSAPPRAARARRKLPRGTMLGRVVPGGALVAAALILPEFSVGAGHNGRGPAVADPPEPSSAPGPGRAQRVSGEANEPLAGVRYAALLDLSATPSFAVSPSRIATFDPAAGVRDAILSQPAQRAALPDIREVGSAPRAVRADARKVDPERTPRAAEQHLDKAAAFAAAVLNDFTAPPGLPGDTALTVRTSATPPQVDSLDQAAHYSASVIDKFVDQTASRPGLEAVAPAPDGGALSIAAPSAPQTVAAAAALAAVPTSAAVQAAESAAPLAPVAAAAPVASQPAPAALAPAASGRGMIEQVTPARIAAARVVPAPAAAPPAARAPIVVPVKPAPAPPPVAAAVPKPAPALSAPASAAAPRLAEPAFNARLLTRIDGRASGELDFQQTPAGLKVRLGSVADVLADRMPAGELARIRGSAAGNAWLSLAELQAQGIPISYDPVYDEFNIGREDTRPRAARKVHIDQIGAPERDAGAGSIDQIRRR